MVRPFVIGCEFRWTEKCIIRSLSFTVELFLPRSVIWSDNIVNCRDHKLSKYRHLWEKLYARIYFSVIIYLLRPTFWNCYSNCYNFRPVFISGKYGPHRAAWLEATVTILGSPQNENRCINQGRGRLPRPLKSFCRCSTRDGAASADDQQGMGQSTFIFIFICSLTANNDFQEGTLTT